MKSKSVDRILIQTEERGLELITEVEFQKLAQTEQEYKLFGVIKPRFKKQYLSKLQQDEIIKSIRYNAGKFHFMSCDDVIKNIKSIVFNEINS